MKKPFLIFRKSRGAALLLLLSLLLLFCGVRLYELHTESVATMAGGEERQMQSLFGLLQQKLEE